MANGTGSNYENANGNEAGEFLVSSIRAGMKREFAMMMAQADRGIVMGHRRITRSQNSSIVAKKNAEKNGKSGKNSDQGLRKKKKEDKNAGVAEMAKKVEMIDVEMLGKDGEILGLVGVEEEETKSDIVDVNSDDERKKDSGHRAEEVMEEIVEKEEVMDEDCKKEDLIKEPKDGIVEHMDEDLVLVKEEKRVKIDTDSSTEDAPVSVEMVGVESEDENTEKVAAANTGTGVRLDREIPIKTYFRRFKRSALKPKVEEAVKQSKEEQVPEQSIEEEVLEQSGTEVTLHEDVLSSNSLVSVSTSSELEMKVAKKVELSKIPARLKDLLHTGLLEGLPVRYIRGSRVSKPGETGLKGVIQGSGMLCFCDECQGIQVVTPNQFELHAHSGNKRPPEYIYLENGKTLRDVLNICKVASLDSLELAIQTAIGRSVAKPICCSNCTGRTSLNGTGLCDSGVALRESKQKTTQSSDTNAGPLLPVSSPKSDGKMHSSCPRNQSQGKLTKKDLSLHKLVFESSFFPDGTPFAYYAHGKKLNAGYKSGSGIFCNCCNQLVSPSLFEAHAGCASRRKPYLQIFTSDGVSLHEWSLSIKENMDKSTDQNDDVCSVCKGLGQLLCCDMCPRAFHKECIHLARIPEGTWFCRYCDTMVKNKENLKRNQNAVAAGRVAGLDPTEEVKKRCVRILGAAEPEVGGCVLCRGHDFSKADFGPHTVILCDQCEREYHVGCLKEHGMDDFKELPSEKWFCCRECCSIHSALQQLVNDGRKRLPDHLLSIIRKKHEDNGSEDNSDLNISWRLFHGKMTSDENRKWLSDALSVFHDCFDPIGDSSKSDHDLIPIMIEGRSNIDQDFGGMYSALLIVNSEVVSAGIFRIFGQEVAEIPLIATSNSFQNKGYFQALFGCIESFLESMNVKDLVLPAAREAEAIWTNKFSFQKITAEQLNLYKKDYQMMIFQGTSVLHKTLARLQ